MTPASFLAVLVVGATAAPGAPAAEPLSLALVVAANRGAGLDRPPLQYADDDGAKYHAIFASVAGEENAVLLADLDRDTARLFPGLPQRALSPTRGNVEAATRQLARAAADARASGRPVRFYFVFAGHGDVDRGRGFLELSDGPFTANDLKRLIETIAASESHVILDSCNSFFVVNPRAPGGRRFATPRDAAERIARRLPNVGVFLSTSAEAEVFEWSELQSGVFSHAVRSGLLGAADADHDGRITYEELAGFVETAAAEVKNPLFRPKIFARGPNGEDGRTLLDVPRAGRVTIDADGPLAVRLAVRDGDGLRWLDAHKEPGEVLGLWVPRAVARGLTLERLSTGPEPVVEQRFPVANGTERVILTALEGRPGDAEARGAGEIFRMLFARPFGPKALAAYREERRNAPEPVFGISHEDAERLDMLLAQLSAAERERRVVRGTGEVVAGLALGAFTALALPDVDRRRPAFAAVGFSASALVVGLGVRGLVLRSAGERTYDRFRAGMAEPGTDQAQLVADADRRLHAMLQTQSGSREENLAVGGIVLATGIALLVEPEADGSGTESRFSTRLAGAGLACAGAIWMVSTLFSDNPTEKIIELWSKEPSRHRLSSLSLQPVEGGALIVLSSNL